MISFTFHTTLALLSIQCAFGLHLQSWMKDIKQDISSKTLPEITLPGTHDSGAYYLTSDLVPGDTSDFLEDLIKFAEELGIPVEDVITPWAQAQDQTLYEQLNGGIRYIDMRAGWDETNQEWRTFHFEFGNTIEVLISDVAKFLSEQDSEVVVIEVSHFDGSPSDDDLIALQQLIESYVGEYLYPRTNGFNSTIAEMIEMNQRLVLSFENDNIVASDDKLWYSSSMVNSYADSCDLDTMVAFNYAEVDDFVAYTGDGLFKISWTLTPDAKCVTEGILPRHPWGLLDLADTANGDSFTDFVSTIFSERKRPGNLFLIDHYESSDIIEAVVEFNTL